MPLKKSDGNFSPVLSLGNVDSPSSSRYCTPIRTTEHLFFPLIFYGSYGMHLLPSVPLCLFAFFASASSLFSLLPCGQFDITRYYLQAAAWMFLVMPPLLCLTVDSMLVTGETFCLQNQHSKQFWEHGTIGLHSNCHLLPWRKHRLPSHSEYGAFM